MNGRSRRPTMADVARAAGVSTMTVSRVINDHPSVTPDTRRRVVDAIQQLSYRADIAARLLAGGRSHVVGIISVQPEPYGPTVSVHAIESAARRAGQLVSFITVREPTLANMTSAVEALNSAHVEGIVVVARLQATVDTLAELRAPVPIVAIAADGASGDVVSVDQELGARLATRHLLDLGHDTVHHIRGPRRWIDADARANGWRKELRSQKRTPGRCLVGNWTPRSGFETGAVLAADPTVTAIFVANDQMAVGVLLALHAAGRDVPGDVSVVGFDDIPESGYLRPPLTTVRQPFDELARAAVSQLLTAIEGGDHANVVVAPQLIVRESTAPPRR